MKIFVMSGEYSEIYDALEKIKDIYNFDIITTDKIECFNEPEQYHADMQILKIKDNIFILEKANLLFEKIKNNYKIQNIIKVQIDNGKYPECIKLNCLLLNNKLYCKNNFIDSNVKDFCQKNLIEIVNVNQGYARCSTLVLNDLAVITSDTSICNALTENNIDVLKISYGNITLKGYDYGFIGGAAVMLNCNTLAFFGDISLHPDYFKIKQFCEKYEIKILSLVKNLQIIDIGGITFL